MQLSLHIIRTLEKRVMFRKDLCHVDTIYGQVQRYVPIGFIFPVMENWVVSRTRLLFQAV